MGASASAREEAMAGTRTVRLSKGAAARAAKPGAVTRRLPAAGSLHKRFVTEPVRRVLDRAVVRAAVRAAQRKGSRDASN